MVVGEERRFKTDETKSRTSSRNRAELEFLSGCSDVELVTKGREASQGSDKVFEMRTSKCALHRQTQEAGAGISQVELRRVGCRRVTVFKQAAVWKNSDVDKKIKQKTQCNKVKKTIGAGHSCKTSGVEITECLNLVGDLVLKGVQTYSPLYPTTKRSTSTTAL